MTPASLRQQGLGVRAIAGVLGRSPATTSRELRRNADAGHYASTSAHDGCRQRRLQSRPARKLDADGVLLGVVRQCLGWRWSPEQIALTLAGIYPKGHACRVSHETIYHCIYAQPVGELKRKLVACLRQARNKRTPRSTGDDRRADCGHAQHPRAPTRGDGSPVPWPLGVATSSRGPTMPARWALWWSAPAGC